MLGFASDAAVSLISNISEAGEEQVNSLQKLFAFAVPLRGMLGRGEAHSAVYSREVVENILQESKDGKRISYESICAIVDADQTKTITFNEYTHALKIMDIDQSESRMLLSFARDDVKSQARITFDAFEQGMQRTHREMAQRMLSLQSIDFWSMVKTTLMTLGLFCVFLGFVFVGMSAFAPAGTLGTVVNGCLPALAGSGSSGLGTSKVVEVALARLTDVAAVAVEAVLQSKGSISGEAKLDKTGAAFMKILSGAS
jgi:hypothetical protein